MALAARHVGAAFDLAVSENGGMIASAGEDRSLRLWKIGTRREILRLYGHKGSVTAVDFAPGDSVVASGGSDGAICLWSLPTGNRLRCIEAHASEILDLAFASDGSFLISAGADTTVKSWKTSTGGLLHIFNGHSDQIESVGFLENDSEFFSASLDGQVRKWQSEAEESEILFSQPSDEIWAAQIHPDKKVLALGGTMTGILFVDATRRGTIRNLRDGRSSGYESISFSPDGNFTFAASEGTIRAWNTDSGRLIGTATLDDARIWSIRCTSDSTKLFVGDSSGNIFVFDENLEAASAHFGDTQPVASNILFSSDGKVLTQINEDGSLVYWMTTETEPVPRFVNGLPEKLISLSTDGNSILASLKHKEVQLYRTTNSETTIAQTIRTREEVSAAAFSPDSAWLALGMFGGKIVLLNLLHETLLEPFGDHGFSVTSLVFTAGSDYLVAGGENGRLVVWKVPEGEHGGEFAGHTQAITTVAVDQKDDLALSGGLDSLVFAWNLENNSERYRIRLDGSVKQIAFAKNTEQFLTITHAGSASLWNSTNGQPIRQLDGFGVSSGTLSPDGNWIALVRTSGHVEIWSVRDGRKFADMLAAPNSRWAISLRDGTFAVSEPVPASIYWIYRNGAFDFEDQVGQKRDPTILRTFLTPIAFR